MRARAHTHTEIPRFQGIGLDDCGIQEVKICNVWQGGDQRELMVQFQSEDQQPDSGEQMVQMKSEDSMLEYSLLFGEAVLFVLS